MKAIFLTIFLLICSSINAFEIKPMGPFYNDLLKIKYTDNPNLACDKTLYKASNAKPVHEKITLEALKQVCDKYQSSINDGVFHNKCSLFKDDTSNNISSNDALLSGVQFNDDPTRILSRDNEILFTDAMKAKYFESISEIPKSLTNRSHYGDLQFLHAMKSTESELAEQTRDNAVKYITENFNFAKKFEILILNKDTKKLDELLEKKVEQENYYHPIFIGNEGRCNYKDFSRRKVVTNMKDDDFKFKTIFSQCGSFGKLGEYPTTKEFKSESLDEQAAIRARAAALLAIGSALHLIQDSYSTSHTNRNDKDEITEFYKYTKDQRVPGEYKLHCAHDQYSENNKKQINLAIKMSSEFLSLFVENNCDPSDDQSKNTCKAIIKTWLENKVFILADEPKLL